MKLQIEPDILPSSLEMMAKEVQAFGSCCRRTSWRSAVYAIEAERLVHQGIAFEEPLSTDSFGLDRESTTLLISESQPLSAGLFAQGSILPL